MKRQITFLFLIFLYAANPALAFMPFAPKADIPANPSNDPDLARIISSVEKAAILEDYEVGFPPFPDAEVVQTEEGQGPTLPMVCLVTPDKVTTVAAFYRQKLPDWEEVNVQGESLFWKEGTKEDALQGKIVTIRISESDLLQKLSDTKTEIRIWYNP